MKKILTNLTFFIIVVLLLTGCKNINKSSDNKKTAVAEKKQEWAIG